MATENLGLPSVGVPSVDFTALIQFLPTLFWIFAGIILLFMVMRMMSHRILVDFDDKVKNGYVIKSGRYAKVFDKKRRVFMLKPMFGGDVIPDVPTEYMQKTKGMPFIGPKRKLELLRINKHTLVAVTPEDSESNEMKAYDINSQMWTFQYEKEAFLRKLNKKDIFLKLSFLVPVFTIIMVMFMFGAALFVQMGLYNYFTNEIANATTILKGVLGQ